MNNYLLKALAYDKQVRIYVVRCEEALNEIGDRLNYFPSALAAVGRVMAFTSMMGGMLKLEETVTVKVDDIVLGTGTASSKKEAEQLAAKDALNKAN